MPDEGWPLLHIESLMATGRYATAKEVLEKALEKFPNALRLRFTGIEVMRMNNDAVRASVLREEIDRLGGSRAWAYRLPEERVTLARAALLLGADPKRVLEVILDPVKKEAPDFRGTHIASGELALDKNDFALAARTFAKAAKKFPDDPDIQFGLARAFAPSDAEATTDAVAKTLELNPNHVGARLLLAGHQIDSEAYDEAAKTLDSALAINPANPGAHALRAVLANLRSDENAEREARDAALKPWPKNPAVPHLIGTRLSAKYRFAEGAKLQRQAIEWDPAFLPAKAQLAQDLLRLGDDEAGWALADEVQKADPYDVVAYNLVTLRDAIAHFRTLKSAHFTVKMDPREADIYGAEVLTLLESAHDTLTKKYGVTLKERTIVEIFPDQKDFAIRTFGLPGGAGYLGVCFGRVITANSPAARPGGSANWQAVLWHEFGHVVTLTMTRNKMPRWLSEGISVYEERQRRGNWGEQMSPRYRRMILGEDLTPVSQLSAAFLRPKTPAHLQFAYYEASLVVQWLVEKWGLGKLRALLADLGRGVAVNTALSTRFEPIAKLDADFAEYARARAKATGPKLDWTEPTPAELRSPQRLDDWIAANPDNFTSLSEKAGKHFDAREWEAAKAPLRRLIALYPDQHEADSAYAMMARAHRELGETKEEEAMLGKVVELCADAADAAARLMEIAAARKDWKTVLANAAHFNAVNPLAPTPHRFAAEAAEALGDKPAAIASYKALLALDPLDPAEMHFRLALLLHATGKPEAKRHVLLALEEAPRFRPALELLLEISAARIPASTPQKR